MASQYGTERDRGAEESPQQLTALRERWPRAFPVKPDDVRPLAIGAAGEIAAAMSWSMLYTRGVLCRWKMATAYCRAVLCCSGRLARSLFTRARTSATVCGPSIMALQKRVLVSLSLP
jgi:hypothetical protein